MLGSKSGERGVLEMAAEDIFSHISATSDREFLLRVSFVEIYNETIRDLLSDAVEVGIYTDKKRGGAYCNAVEHAVPDLATSLNLTKRATTMRSNASSDMNANSSRAHLIVKLVLKSRESAAEANGAALESTLNIVDLAGSEGARHATTPTLTPSAKDARAMAQRSKEAAKINQSLLSLSTVIRALSQPGTPTSFRSSKVSVHNSSKTTNTTTTTTNI